MSLQALGRTLAQLGDVSGAWLSQAVHPLRRALYRTGPGTARLLQAARDAGVRGQRARRFHYWKEAFRRRYTGPTHMEIPVREGERPWRRPDLVARRRALYQELAPYLPWWSSAGSLGSALARKGWQLTERHPVLAHQLRDLGRFFRHAGTDAAGYPGRPSPDGDLPAAVQPHDFGRTSGVDGTAGAPLECGLVAVVPQPPHAERPPGMGAT